MDYFRKVLYFIIFFIPFSFALNLQKDVDISFLRVVISFLFIFLIFYLLYKGKNFYLNRFKNNQTYFYILFFLWSFLSFFWAVNSVFSVRKSLFFATIIPVYFLIIYFIDTKEKLDKVLNYFILGGFYASLIGVIQFLSQFIFSLDKIYNFWAYNISLFLYGQNFGTVVIQNQSWFVNVGGKDFLRAISLFPDPHTFALYLSFVIPLTVGFFLYNNKKNKKKFIFKIFIMILALLFTFSRGAYIGVLASSLFMLGFYFWYFKVKLNKRAIFYTLSFFGILLIIFTNTLFGDRFLSSFSLSDVSNSGRIQIWKTSSEVFLQNLIFGVGLGNLPIFFDPTASIKSPINAHNTFLDILSELGVVGFLLFFGFLIYSFFGLSFKKDKFDYLRFFIIWSLIWYLIHSFFETSIFSVPVLISFSFVLAISVILSKKIKGRSLV